MAKQLYNNFEEWIEANGWTEEDIEQALERVKYRRNIYGILCLIPPLGVVLAPFWFTALLRTRQFRYRTLDLNVTEPNILVRLIYGFYMIGTLFVYPLVMGKIIARTNWGMGLNKIGKDAADGSV